MYSKKKNFFSENRTLEEIELHFADNQKKITDRKIAKINENQNGYEKKPSKPKVIGYDEVAKKKLKNGYGKRTPANE